VFWTKIGAKKIPTVPVNVTTGIEVSIKLVLGKKNHNSIHQAATKIASYLLNPDTGTQLILQTDLDDFCTV